MHPNLVPPATFLVVPHKNYVKEPSDLRRWSPNPYPLSPALRVVGPDPLDLTMIDLWGNRPRTNRTGDTMSAMSNLATEINITFAAVANTWDGYRRVKPNDWGGFDVITEAGRRDHLWSGVRVAQDDTIVRVIRFHIGGSTGDEATFSGTITPQLINEAIRAYL